jgi:ribonuclease HI
MRLEIRTDGGARGNPGPAAAGVVIKDEQAQTVFACGFFLGKATNNVAEYSGILRALEAARELGGTELELFSDSELIVKQLNGEYRVKNAHLKEYYRQIVALLHQFDKVSIQHVYRSDNVEADALVNQALDAEMDIMGELSSSTKVKTEHKVICGAARLGDKVKFSASGVYREILGRQGNLVTELICLDAGQKCSGEGNWRQATITVMRGKGTICFGQEKQNVVAGSWLLAGTTDSVDLAANTGEQMVVILTMLK